MNTRPRQFALAAVVALLAIVVSSCDETTDAQRSQVVSLINSERSSRKLPKLQQASDLNAKAGSWAAKVRDDCKLSHSPRCSPTPASAGRVASRACP